MVLSRRVVGSLNGILKIIQQLVEVIALTTAISMGVVAFLSKGLNIVQQLVEVIALSTVISMGVVAFLSKGLISGITKAIYTTVIKDAGVFTDANLSKKINYFI